MADDEEQPQHDWAGPKGLRLATVASFVPAFPLCLAHGITSGAVVPAVGLVPLAASAGIGIALLTGRAQALHPSGIFAADFVLAGSLMVVLVFTWIIEPRGRDAGLAMLASYATMPLIANLYVGGADPRPGETYYGMRVANHLSAACSLIHFYLATRAVYIGLALDSLVQWMAWQAVPPDCPNCHTRLRPSLPQFPWFRRSNGEYTPLLVNDEENRYHDEEEGQGPTFQPSVEDVIRKDRKGKASAGESTQWSP